MFSSKWLPESEWLSRAWGMAEMQEEGEEAEDTLIFIIWPYYTSDCLLKLSHVSCSMLPGLWVMKNIWRMPGYNNFPSRAHLSEKRDYEALQWLWALKWPSSQWLTFWCNLAVALFWVKVGDCINHTILHSMLVQNYATGHLTELAKAVSSCVHTVTPVC